MAGEQAKIIELRRGQVNLRVKRYYDKHIRPIKLAKRAATRKEWHRPISAMDACWAAGHFEGEGTVLIHKKSRGTARWSPRVSLISTDREVIEFFCRYWPTTVAGPYSKNGKINSSKWKPSYRWNHSDQFKVREFLRTISPYLKRTIVRERVAIVIEFCDRALASYRKHGQEDWKELLYDKLKPLNKRGR